jgi:hypothetical protein
LLRWTTVKDITDVFLLRPFADIAALSSAENEQLLNSSVATAVPSINAFPVA